MTDMPRKRPDNVHREFNRHGNPVWYHRVGKGPRTRLHAAYGTEEFKAEIEAAKNGTPLAPRGKAAAGSLRWLWERYRTSAAWAELSKATRRQRENIMEHVLKLSGHKPFTSINRAAVVGGKDKRAETPAQARNFLDCMRGLFRWALDAGHVKVDPTAGVKNPKRKKGPGFAKWTEDEVAAYEARWPIGTRERVWLDVLLYTGLRRGDAVLLGRQHVRDGVATLRTEKSGETITVTLPILPILQRTLDAGPCGELTFIAGVNRKRLVKESFGTMFREAARAAGVQKSAHGLRKMGATRAANAGATVAQLEAIFGWRGGGMAAHYTQEADRVRLAREAMDKLAGTPAEHPIPAPQRQVRGSSGKRQ